jgi:hypothetical protein
VYSFCDNVNVQLQSSTAADDSRIIWRVYHNSITLILVTCDCNLEEWCCYRLLDVIFAAMVVRHGLDDIICNDNIENLKKLLQACYCLIDCLLMDSVLKPVRSLLTFSTEVTYGAADNSLLQTHLDGFTSAAHSSRGCVLVAGRVAVATNDWWQLSTTEQLLLPRLVSTQTHCASRDLVVFLPDTSPQVANRLLTFSIVDGVDVCVICGSSPSLLHLERKVPECFFSLIALLAMFSKQEI